MIGSKPVLVSGKVCLSSEKKGDLGWNFWIIRIGKYMFLARTWAERCSLIEILASRETSSPEPPDGRKKWRYLPPYKYNVSIHTMLSRRFGSIIHAQHPTFKIIAFAASPRSPAARSAPPRLSFPYLPALPAAPRWRLGLLS